jgi:hypothetical protein
MSARTDHCHRNTGLVRHFFSRSSLQVDSEYHVTESIDILRISCRWHHVPTGKRYVRQFTMVRPHPLSTQDRSSFEVRGVNIYIYRTSNEDIDHDLRACAWLRFSSVIPDRGQVGRYFISQTYNYMMRSACDNQSPFDSNHYLTMGSRLRSQKFTMPAVPLLEIYA